MSNTNFNKYYKIVYKHREKFTEQDIELLNTNLSLKKNEKIIDLGCGYGRISNPLIKEGFDVTGIDFTSHLIDEAKNNCGYSNNYIEGNFYNLQKHFKKNSFDKAYSMFSSIGHDKFKQDKSFFEGVFNILKPGGYFMIEYENFLFHLQYNNLYKNIFVDIDENYRLLENSYVDTIRSKIVFNNELYDNGKIEHKRGFELNLYSHKDIIDMAKNAGFEFVKLHGRFDSNNVFWYEPQVMFVFTKK